MQSSLGTGQRVVLELPGDGAEADDLTVAADPARLRQVLLNLLRNASLYSPEGSTIRLGADWSSRSAANARERANGTGPRRRIVGGVHLWVADEGVGLTAEECERVFERFWRGPLSVTSGRPGAGLGLSICRGLAEAMDGHIWAESAGPGKGSTFHVVLPEAASDIMRAPTTGAAGDSARTQPGMRPSPRCLKMRVRTYPQPRRRDGRDERLRGAGGARAAANTPLAWRSFGQQPAPESGGAFDLYVVRVPAGAGGVVPAAGAVAGNIACCSTAEPTATSRPGRRRWCVSSSSAATLAWPEVEFIVLPCTNPWGTCTTAARGRAGGT